MANEVLGLVRNGVEIPDADLRYPQLSEFTALSSNQVTLSGQIVDLSGNFNSLQSDFVTLTGDFAQVQADLYELSGKITQDMTVPTSAEIPSTQAVADYVSTHAGTGSVDLKQIYAMGGG